MADKYTIDRDAEKLDLLGEPKAEPKAVICPKDQAEMNYHAPTDQWQCPVCLETNGGKPQSESTDNGDSKEPDPP